MADVNDEAVLAALDAYEEAPARRAHHKRRGAPPLSASPTRNRGKRPREVRDAHFTEPKRRRTSGASVGASAGALGASGASDARKALSALLQKSIGFPLPSHSSAFRLDKPRLRDFEGRECPGDSAIGGVYWIHRDAAAAVLANEPRKYARPSLNDEADKAPCTKRGGALQKKKAADTKRVEPKWFEHEPWFPQLNVQPAASGMNPRPPPPFSVWYTHSAPDKQHDWIGVPRFFGLSHFGFPRKDVRKDGAPMAPGIAFDPHGRRPFRPEQRAAIDALLTSLRRCGGGFVEADCGFGKTAIIIYVLLTLGVRGAIICTQEVLMHQMRHDILGKPWTWADLSALELTSTGSVTEAAGVACPITGHDLTHLPPSELARAHCVDGTKKKCSRLTSKAGYQSWLALSSVERGVRAASLVCAQCGGHPGPAPAWDVPSPPKEGWAPGVRVGWLQGAYLDKKGRVSKKCRVEDTDIVLVSAKSASDCDYPWASFGIGAVAFDEAHRVASPTISQVAPRLSCRYIFGVSATPARLDGSEHALYWLLGPTAFVYKRTAEVTGRRGAVRVRQVEYTRGDAKEVVYRDGRLGFATMVNNLVLDAERNKLILALASDAMVQGRRKILLITSTILHAVLLSRALKAQGFYDTTVLRGGAKPSTVAYAQNPLCRVVVATYHYLAEGYDDAYIDTMILATPRSSVQQAVGRCERTMDGKLVPLVYDVVDDFSLFAGMSRKRHTFYKSRAFAIARETDLAALARMEGGGALPTTDELVPDAEEVEAAARKVAEDECSEEDEFWEEECGEDVCWEEE